jgi:hypothetical protein
MGASCSVTTPAGSRRAFSLDVSPLAMQRQEVAGTLEPAAVRRRADQGTSTIPDLESDHALGLRTLRAAAAERPLEAIYREHGPRFRPVVRAIVYDTRAAEDVVQEAIGLLRRERRAISGLTAARSP